MTLASTTAPATERSAVDACWNRIGMRGDKSCVELRQHIHCHNCPVYAAGAGALLDAPLPEGYAAFWTGHFSQAQVSGAAQTYLQRVVVFRLATEWLALSAAQCVEVAEMRPIRTLPQRRGGVLLGLVNIRGALVPCVSLAAVLHLQTAAEPAQRGQAMPRLLVLGDARSAIAACVDEVQGVLRYGPDDLRPVPATLAKAQATYTTALVAAAGKMIGLLDGAALSGAIERGMS